LVYSINESEWKYEEIQPSRRYVTESIGGYGFSEEPYEATIPLKPGSKMEYHVVIIDKVGNHAVSDSHAYRVGHSRNEIELPLNLPALHLCTLPHFSEIQQAYCFTHKVK
jgi:hypothetical protein